MASKGWSHVLATSWKPARLWTAIYVPAGYRVVFSGFAWVGMLLGCTLKAPPWGEQMGWCGHRHWLFTAGLVAAATHV